MPAGRGRPHGAAVARRGDRGGLCRCLSARRLLATCRLAVLAFWSSLGGAVAALAVGGAAHSFAVFALGAGLACAAIVTGGFLGLTGAPQRLGALHVLTGTSRHARPGDEDLFLDRDAVEVAGVYVLRNELVTYLIGGTSPGQARLCEVGHLFLSWRCRGRCEAAELARRLNDWQAARTPLRLLAAKGRCAVLMEDEHHWLELPELPPGTELLVS